MPAVLGPSRSIPQTIKTNIYSNSVLPFVLYGYRTWSLTLREEHRLWVFENRVMMMICGPKRDEVTGVEKTT